MGGHMENTLATMLTMTTYGTWLRGDERGWVDDGALKPPSAKLEAADRAKLKHPSYSFPEERLLSIGQAIGDSVVTRVEQRIYALTVQTWHVHIVIAATAIPLSAVVKCAKDAVRWSLRVARPIWTAGYDKRFCFDDEAVRQRIAYVERHNLERGWPARPWSFIERPDFGLSISPR